jgi:hypothetical protein
MDETVTVNYDEPFVQHKEDMKNVTLPDESHYSEKKS